MTCGPWRPIVLETYVSRISDLFFHTEVLESLASATVDAQAEIEYPTPGANIKFELSISGESISSAIVPVSPDGFANHVFEIEKPALWYPHNYGKQPLYTLCAKLLADENEDSEIDSLSKRLGVRRARLVQRPLKDQPGTTFFFEINNVPIFCGGSNWIPADNFIPRISDQKYRNWLQLMVDGNQIMVRLASLSPLINHL